MPAVHFLGAVRENVVALLVAAVGSMATVAWAPVVNLDRFQYTVLGLSLVASFLTVFRLGAGWHGLGTRGVLTVVAGSLMLALTLGYAELLRRYGTESLVDPLDEAVRWSHHHLGAFPRPIVALLGVPALTWGTHMRARRRQGWWVCAFGVALTAPVAYALVDPGRTVARGHPRHGVRRGDRARDRLPADPPRPAADRPPTDRAARTPARRDRGGDGRPARARPHPRPVVNRA